jgi:hypothetical protein
MKRKIIVNLFGLSRRLSLKYLFLILFIVLIVINLYFIFQYHYFQYAQTGQVADTFNVYRWMIADSLNCDNPQEIVSKLVYAYGYYPAGTKYIPSSSPLNIAIEQGREQTITLLLLILQNKTNAHLGNDLDQWIKTFGYEQTQDAYNSMKIARKELNLPDLRTNLILPNILNCCNCSSCNCSKESLK